VRGSLARLRRQSRTPSGLIVLAPIRSGEEESLRAQMLGLATGIESPFASVEGTHFARLTLVALLPDRNGEPQWPGAYLLLAAEVDGSVEDWVELAERRIGNDLHLLLGRCEGYAGAGCEGYPGAYSAHGAIAEYLRLYRVAAGFSIASYRGTVEQVARALRLRGQLREFAALRAGLSAAEARARWHSVMRA
jgi:hypothetical protein